MGSSLEARRSSFDVSSDCHRFPSLIVGGENPRASGPIQVIKRTSSPIDNVFVILKERVNLGKKGCKQRDVFAAVANNNDDDDV